MDAGDLDARVADAAAPVDASVGRGSLVIHELWTRVMPTDDPFDDSPAGATCSLGATMPETLADERVFSVDTGLCGYVTATQKTQRAIAEGETIKVRLWHFELTSAMPAEAHAAVVIDGLAVLDERVAIPQAGGLISKQLKATRAIAEGASVHFHLHNHGANSWSLVEVSAGP